VALLRNGGQTLEAFIDRGEIPLVSIDNAYMIDNHTGVIKINRFSNNTYTEFMKALEGMIEKDKLSHLIIDLRGNPGGYLSAATDILDQLFTERKLLVYTNGRTNGRKEYRSTGQPFYNIDKIAVLIDEGSASASEILAGAIQDHDRGVIVGRRSFGKGLVQEQYDLSNGGALRLTVARYYTPSGRCIQKSYREGEDHYSEDLDDRYVHGELDSRDSIKIKDSTRYYTGIGRIVYGGGGIIPDVFVPLNKMLKNEPFNKATATMSGSIYNYWIRNLDKLKPLSLSFDDFKNTYTVDNELYKKVLDEAKITTVDSAFEKSLKTRLKAELARLVFQDDINAWYKIMYEEDEAFQKAKQYIYDDTWRDK
jgi:carboxyl-terminal processing protease